MASRTWSHVHVQTYLAKDNDEGVMRALHIPFQTRCLSGPLQWMNFVNDKRTMYDMIDVYPLPFKAPPSLLGVVRLDRPLAPFV